MEISRRNSVPEDLHSRILIIMCSLGAVASVRSRHRAGDASSLRGKIETPAAYALQLLKCSHDKKEVTWAWDLGSGQISDLFIGV